jgi:hypothetical protein
MREETVSEVILPLCKTDYVKGELEGVEPSLNMFYPPQPSLTKGGNDLGNSLGSISFRRVLFPNLILQFSIPHARDQCAV